MRKQLFIDALRISRERIKTHPEFLNRGFIHFSFLIFRGKIIAVGINHGGNNPLQYGYPINSKIHSEIDAFKKAKGLLRGDSFSIINIRLGREGNLRSSKPCKTCESLLNAFGCTEIYYTTEIGFEKL